MSFSHYAFFYCFLFVEISSFLNQNEIQLSLDLIKNLGIRQCIIAGTRETRISVIKNFSSSNIQTLYLNHRQFANYVEQLRNEEVENVYFRTGVILEDENSLLLEEISRLFESKRGRVYFKKLHNFIWLTFAMSRTPEPYRLMVPYDSQFLVIEPENETTYKLKEIYTMKKKHFSIVFGLWQKDFGLKISNFSLYRRRLNLQRSEIRIVYDLSSKLVRTHPRILLFDEIMDGFSAMMNITKCEDNANSLGLMALKLRAKVGDVSGNPVPLEMQYISFSQVGPFWKEITNWYMKYPRTELRSDYYLQPLNTSVWLALLSVGLLGTIFIILSYNSIHNKKRPFIDNLFLAFESFCNQCGNDNVDGHLRLICISLRLTTVIVIGSYGAIVTSFFALEVFKPPFTNRQGFMANGEYKFLLKKNYSLKSLQGNLGIYKYSFFIEKYGEVIDSNLNEELFEKICQGKFVASDQIDSENSNQIYHYNLTCKVFKIPEAFGFYWHSILLTWDSPFTNVFQKNLIRFFENGIQMRFRIKANVALDGIEKSMFQPIKMSQMMQILSIPFVGILLGALIILMEIIKRNKF